MNKKQSKELVRFEFGKNWASYSKKINDSTLQKSIYGLKKLLPNNLSINKMNFLDIGCGSGLHSLSAKKLGFKQVVSIDYDKNSVLTAMQNAKNFGSKIHVFEDDILETKINKKFNVVYSWGVLHHTGNLKKAIKNSSNLVEDKGIYIIAIYRKTKFCKFWKSIKFFYCKSNSVFKLILFFSYFTVLLLRLLFAFKINNLINIDRGMNLYYDAIDWLGGYPYESASKDEILNMVGDKFKLLNSYSTSYKIGLLGTGCAEYVFQRK